jgi:hypothetical protein
VDSWKFVLDEAVFQFFASRRANERRRLLAAFEVLRTDPNRKPDYYTKDATGRTLHVWTAQPFLITYWLDVYVNELRIVNVQRIRF